MCTMFSMWLFQVRNVKDHQLDNRMESFFLAETTKYLNLMFEPEGQCVIDAGMYMYFSFSELLFYFISTYFKFCGKM